MVILVAGLLVRSAIAFALPAGFDEGYYYLYTQHLDWSYFDHPLLVALATGIGPWLTGIVSPFTIRVGSLLLFTGSLLLLYRTSTQLFSIRAAELTLAIASLIPIFLLAFGVMTLPDSPLIFFWTATLTIAAAEFFRSADGYQPSYRLALIGLSVGLACLGKYHGLALGFGLVGFCLTRQRRVFTSPWFLVGVGLFGLAIAPILIWNLQHDWISLRFQSGRAVPDRGYSLTDLLVTFLVGAAYLLPSFGFPLWWASGKATWRAIQANRAPKGAADQNADSVKLAFVLWTALPLMVGFTLMGGYRPILPTWAMPGFWSASLLLGVWAEQWQGRSPRAVKRWLTGSGLAIAPLLLIALLHVRLGVLQKPSQFALLGGWLPPSYDASVQLLDLAQVRSALTRSQILDSVDFLFTNDIYLAGQVGMAIAPNPKPITCFDSDLRGFAFWSTATEWVGKTGLLMTPAAQAEQTIAQYTGYFRQIQLVGEISLQRGGAIVEILRLYRCQPLLKPYPRPYSR